MSVQAISFVLDHSDAQGAERLVLISIANHAGALTDTGTFEAWPGIETIAEEAGLDNVRTVKNAITRLVKRGELERSINAAPDGRLQGNRRPNLYKIPTKARTLEQQFGLGPKAPRRFTETEIHRHPAFAHGNATKLAMPNGEIVARGRRVPLNRPAPAQVFVVHDRLYLRIGDPEQTAPGDELIPIDPTSGVSSDDTPRETVENPHLGVSSDDTPDPQGCRGTTARGVVPRRVGVSSDDAQGCRPATPKPSMNRHEPSLNRDDDVEFPARDLTSDIHSGPPPAARNTDEARQRLADLMNRRTDRPTSTTGLRTGREALTAARSRAAATTTPGAEQ